MSGVFVWALSSQMAKWTHDPDRRPHCIFCFPAQATDFTLKGFFSTGNVNELVVIAWPDADLGVRLIVTGVF